MEHLVNKVIKQARSFLGVRYQWGGNSYMGIDCSGLIQEAFKAIGVMLPRIAGDQAKTGSFVEIDELQPGDLVFFTDQPGNTTITHVGMVTKPDYDKNSVIFIHASTAQGVVEDDLLKPWWQELYLTASRPHIFKPIAS
ncbi:MAG: C40 family peptidase [Microscillaceae bacterium]|nr:C40 family peptidase [Microscillaceae bacterium]MDW8460972.1 C40 family peptidase [Cytophagales bacterium]